MNSNFRHYFMGLSLMIGVIPWNVFAQVLISSFNSDSIEDRIIQLERISNAQGQLLTQLQQQLSDNQNDTDLLRGQIQENQYQLNKIIEYQKQIILQSSSLSSNNGKAIKPTMNEQSRTNTSMLVVDTDAVAQNSNESLNKSDINADYQAAIALMQDKARQDDAILAFQNFVKKYPYSVYQPNAQYWLGQINYDKGKKDDAAFYFASVVKKYPKSPKAHNAMFKVGLIMQDKGDTAKAKAVYRQVLSKYPNTDSAKQAQSRLELMRK